MSIRRKNKFFHLVSVLLIFHVLRSFSEVVAVVAQRRVCPSFSACLAGKTA